MAALSSFAVSQTKQQEQRVVVEFGFARDIELLYKFKGELGNGGNGTVRRAVSLATGIEYACKSIPKVLDPKKFSEVKRAAHLEALSREVQVLQRLKGCLNVVELHEVFEDEVGPEAGRLGRWGDGLDFRS